MNSHPQMTEKVLLRAATAACLAMLASRADAGGLTLYEIGSRDVGLASAGYSARAQDASTVLTNPAGMILLGGTQTMAGAQLLYSDISFTQKYNVESAGGNNGGQALGWLPGASGFISHSLAPNLKVGFGVAGNFGLALRYDNHWVGRYYGKEAALPALSLLPSIAYRLNKRWSVGATVNAMYGIMNSEISVNNIVPGQRDGEFKLDDQTWGWGANIGLLYELDEHTRFGLTYTSKVNLDFKPHAEFNNLGPVLGTALANRGLVGAEIDLGIKVPQGLMASVLHEVDPSWTVLGSIGWQQWSEFGKVDVGIEGNDIKETALKFDDTWHVALGAQYHANDVRSYDFGIAYDSGYQDKANVSTLLPLNSAWRFGLGMHNQVNQGFNWGVAAEYLYGGRLGVKKRSTLPVALGGRGDVVGSYNNTRAVFLSAYANWKF
jgi:long-chain fatty acid transport protein